MAALQFEGALPMADLLSALQNHQAPSDLESLSDVLEQHPFEEFVKARSHP